MKNKFIVMALGFVLGLSAMQAHAVAPNIKMHCINPDLTPKFVSKNNSVAATELVQVNIGIAAGPGTIWANKENDAICRATIDKGYRITSGSAVRDDKNISGFDGMDIRAKNRSITFHPEHEGDDLVFTLYKTDPAARGTANFKFYVTYEKR